MRQAFLIPQEKGIKFATLREDILSSPFVSLKTLYRFSGKVISFCLAIPGCKLYVREVFKAISRHSGSSRPTIKLEANLPAEIEYWRFLDDWKDCFQWRTEHHASVTLYSNASKTAWGGTLSLGGHSLESKNYWLDNSQDINILEAQALLYSLLSFKKHLTSSRVDVCTDNRLLKFALENGGCRSSEVNGVPLKDIFRSCREYNFSLDVYCVPSGEIRLTSLPEADTHCMLSNSAWEQVERLFEPHMFDLMSLDSNCQCNRVGLRLPHFTPCATPESSGINVLAYSLPLDHNIYVFLPLVLIAPPAKVCLGAGFSRRFYYCSP